MEQSAMKPFRRRRRYAALLTLCALTFEIPPAGAQTELIARTFELRPREGMSRQFESGYQRHLDWHLENADRWSWLAWQVTDGERSGLIIDGTFGRTWPEIDTPPNPAGDAADNALHVNPFVERGASQTWRQLDSFATPAEAEARLVLRVEVEVDGITALQAITRASPPRRAIVLELASGGPPTTTIWFPASSYEEVGSILSSEARLLARLSPRRTEIWRFRPDLSSCHLAASRCYRTFGTKPGERR